MAKNPAVLSGCAPLRAITTDSLGLVKVIEVRSKTNEPSVVETWGPPEASRCVLASSFADREKDPVLAVARKNGSIEFLNPLTGNALATIKASPVQGDPIVGLHLFKTRPLDSSMVGAVLTCTEKGKVSLRSVMKSDAPSNLKIESQKEWSVCSGGQVFCSSVNQNEKFALFGGARVDVNLWDLDTCVKTWTAKSPPSNNLGIFIPTWFTAATFLCNDDHRKIVAGTNQHQVRLYDIEAQRRPVISIDFREAAIKAVTADLDGYTVFVGTGTGDLASFDMRTGKLLGCYVGKCSGSIRSIARHPELPLIASCGLDSYLRFWDIKSRQLLSHVFLKQHLTSVAIDSHFSSEESEGSKPEPPSQLNSAEKSEEGNSGSDSEERKGKKSKKKRKGEERERKKDGKKKKTKIQDEEQVSGVEDPDNLEEIPVSKRKSMGEKQSKKKKKREKQPVE